MTTPVNIGLPSKFEKFRTTGVNQLDVAIDIDASSTRFDILSAPPGVGKSLINMTVAKLCEGRRVLYLVSTIPLADQVYKDFHSMGVALIQGMGNYRCNDAPAFSNLMCNEGKCLAGFSCTLRNDGCDYFDAVRAAADTEIVLSNYAYRATTARHSDPTKIGVFDLVICDEAHLLLDWMSSFCAITIDIRVIKSLLKIAVPGNNDLSRWSTWAGSALNVLDAVAYTMRDDDRKALTQLAELRRDLTTIYKIDKSPWVVESWRYGVTLTPVEPAEFLEEYVFLGASKVLLCSASITAADAVAFGCDGDYTYHAGGTGFPVERRPIVWVPTTRVRYDMTEDDLRRWIDTIDDIIDLGLDYRGIIHSVSYDRMHYIYKHSRHQDLMIIHRSSGARNLDAFRGSFDGPPPTISEALDQYSLAWPPRVLVSPIVGTGYDFAYDRARWQIISKIKYLNPTDTLVKARMKLWREKYSLDYLETMAAKDTLQVYGRVDRANDDYGITYVVDDTWGRRVKNNAANPPWFVAAMSTAWTEIPRVEVV